VIFFSDPLQSQPHDPDVKALFRITVVWNIPVACNRASADFIISSPLMSTGYERLVPDYSKYGARLAVSTRSKPAMEQRINGAAPREFRRAMAASSPDPE
jgi:methylglyoxal synthase